MAELVGCPMGFLPMKRDPLDIVQEHESRADEQFSKVMNIDSVFFMALKVDTGLC